jgi:hypothetical protein
MMTMPGAVGELYVAPLLSLQLVVTGTSMNTTAPVKLAGHDV